MLVRYPAVFFLSLAIAATAACAGEPIGDAQPTNINWVTQYGTARREGSKLDRPVMLFLTTDGCIHCVRMKRDSFQDEHLAASLNNSFIPAMIKTDMNSRLARELKVTMFPTTVFIAPDGKILDYIRGYIPKDDFRSRMSHVMDATAASVASRPMP
jgi:thioredoxin-related protein